MIPIIASEKMSKKVLTKALVKNIALSNLPLAEVLVAEREMINYHFLEAALEKIKAITTWAKNGQHAVDLVKQSTDFDIILMDIKMPIMDGFKATRLIKKMNNEIPIIAQTAYTMMDEEDKSYEAGCDAYVSKPIDIKKLLQIINELINKEYSKNKKQSMTKKS